MLANHAPSQAAGSSPPRHSRARCCCPSTPAASRPPPRGLHAAACGHRQPRLRRRRAYPREHEGRCRAALHERPAPRHKRASGACSLRASARIEAVVRAGVDAGPKVATNGADRANRALLLSPTSKRAQDGRGTTASTRAAARASLCLCHGCGTRVAHVAVTACACRVVRLPQPALLTDDRRLATQRLPTHDLDESARPWNWLCQDSRLC